MDNRGRRRKEPLLSRKRLELLRSRYTAAQLAKRVGLKSADAIYAWEKRLPTNETDAVKAAVDLAKEMEADIRAESGSAPPPREPSPPDIDVMRWYWTSLSEVQRQRIREDHQRDLDRWRKGDQAQTHKRGDRSRPSDASRAASGRAV